MLFEVLGPFSWIDLIFIILLLGTIYKGSQRGVGAQMLSLFGYFAIVYVALGYYSLVSRALFGFLLQNWAKPVSFFFVTLFFLFIIKLFERVLRVVEQEDLAVIERAGGMMVAAVRGGVLIGLVGVLMLLMPMESVSRIPVQRSVLSEYFIKMDLGLYSWMHGMTGADIPTAKEHEKNLLRKE